MSSNPKISFKKLTETENYDGELISVSAQFTQSSFYGEWQKLAGRQAEKYLIESEEGAIFFQLITCPLIFGKNYLYIPHGPILIKGKITNDLLKEFKAWAKKIMQAKKAVFLRCDFFPPDCISKVELKKYFHPAPLYSYHSAAFQPKYEWMLDLKRSEEEIFNSFDKAVRYDLRQAEKKNVEVEIVKENLVGYFQDFYTLMQTTAKRNGFGLHPAKYYRDVLRNCEGNRNAFLVIARYQGKILAINVILLFGQSALYLWSGSSNDHKEARASYLAQWVSIREAKKRGAAEYSLGGASPDNKIYQGYSGLQTFKKRWGGFLVEFGDFYDLIGQPFWYWLYNLRKKIKSWH